jgi:hypothetical protein
MYCALRVVAVYKLGATLQRCAEACHAFCAIIVEGVATALSQPVDCMHVNAKVCRRTPVSCRRVRTEVFCCHLAVMDPDVV